MERKTIYKVSKKQKKTTKKKKKKKKRKRIERNERVYAQMKTNDREDKRNSLFVFTEEKHTHFNSG